MKASCFNCNDDLNTKKEDVFVNIGYYFNEVLKKNNLSVDKSIPRIVYICSKCWSGQFKEKPDRKGSYWIYDKEV